MLSRISRRLNTNLGTLKSTSIQHSSSITRYNNTICRYFGTTISSYTIRGRNKYENEDVVKIYNKNIYGIFDGHGGCRIAQLASEFISQKMNFYRLPISDNYIRKIFSKINDEIIKVDSLASFSSGTTCLVAMENNNIIQIINAGDSRAIASVGNKVVQLTNDHKANCKKEQHRIKKIVDIKNLEIYEDSFGTYRIGFLEPTRGFGNTCMHPYYSFYPETVILEKSIDYEFIVMATDGLWDVMQNEQVVDFINSIKFDKNIAKYLANFAEVLGSTDDVSIIISRKK